MENIKLDGENLIGYDDQIKALKENEKTAYHFDSDEKPPSFSKGGTGDKAPQLDSMRVAMGLPPAK